MMPFEKKVPVFDARATIDPKPNLPPDLSCLYQIHPDSGASLIDPNASYHFFIMWALPSMVAYLNYT